LVSLENQTLQRTVENYHKILQPIYRCIRRGGDVSSQYEVRIRGLGAFRAATTDELAALVRAEIERRDVGASAVGARWPVRVGRQQVGVLSYNGRYDETQR
jgi:hypothetical protein